MFHPNPCLLGRGAQLEAGLYGLHTTGAGWGRSSHFLGAQSPRTTGGSKAWAITPTVLYPLPPRSRMDSQACVVSSPLPTPIYLLLAGPQSFSLPGTLLASALHSPQKGTPEGGHQAFPGTILLLIRHSTALLLQNRGAQGPTICWPSPFPP